MTWKHQKPPSGIPARGAGYGGPAKPKPRKAFTAEEQPTPEAKAAGHAAAKTARELAIEHREAAIAVLARVMNDPTAPPQTQADAANKMLNRSDGTPSASVDVTTKGEALAGYVIAAPTEIEDADEWASQHKPR